MEAREYLDRLRAVGTFAQKSELLKDLYDKENECREKFARQRERAEVEGVEDPFLSMVWVHGEASDLMVYQNQVRGCGACGCLGSPLRGVGRVGPRARPPPAPPESEPAPTPWLDVARVRCCRRLPAARTVP